MKRNQWSCEATVVPNGLENPMVRQLGILSADRIPNVFLVRRDGTIAWHSSGFFLKSDFGYPFALRLAMKVHTEVCDVEHAYQALKDGEYAEARRVFSGPFLPEKDERYRWRAPRFHGRALANAGLKQWDAALADIETSIASHLKEFDHVAGKPCGIMPILQRVRARVLEKLGRREEARSAFEAAALLSGSDLDSLYGAFHQRLEGLTQVWNGDGK